MRSFYQISLIFIAVIVSACSDYQKLLKSSDYELKYNKAVEYYNTEDYFRSLSLLEELVTIYRGTARAEEIYYYYAYCHYYQGDNILAGYHFKNFARTYPKSKFKEECLYMSAYCQYLNSPESSLDQTYTYKGIEELQLFINKYPQSERVTECNELIDKLRRKLEIKSFNSAKLYFDLKDYKAAIVALKNSLKDYPDSDFREDIMFLVLKSSYLLAGNSIESKRKERYENTLKEYYAFIDEFPQSKLIKDAERYYENTKRIIEKKQ